MADAPVNDEAPVTPPANEEPVVEEPQVDDAVQDAINEFVGDVKGEIGDNDDPLATPPVEDEPKPEAPKDEAPVEAAPPVTEEKLETATPPAAAVADPGEFAPSDYAYTVTTTDGKEHAIKTPEDADAFAQLLDEDPSLINASELLKFNRNATRMDVGIDSDRKAYDASKADYDAAQATVEARERTVKEIDSGLAYLESKGLVPPVAKDLNTPEAGAKWATDYKDEPGVKERLELMHYMAGENDKRIAAGLNPSFDVTAAYSALQLEKLQNQGKEQEDQEAELRRKRGAQITGQSALPPEPQGKGKEIVGTGGKLSDLLLDY